MAVYKRAERKIKLPKRERPKDQLQELWELRIQEGEKIKEEWRKEFGTKDLQRAYEGHQQPEWWPNKGWFTINLILSSFQVLQRNIVPKRFNVKVSLSKTYRADPQIVQLFNEQKGLREAVLQYYTDQLKASKEVKLAYLNALWEFGCIKVGYGAETELNENAGLPMQGKDDSFLFDNLNGEVLLEPERKITKEEFFFDSVDPECIVVDRSCQNVPEKTGRWIAHKIFRPIGEVQKDPFYKNTENLEPSYLEDYEKDYLKRSEFRTPHIRRGSSLEELEEDMLVVIYEIYDLIRGETLSIARGGKLPIRGPEPTPKGIDSHPFIFLKFIERRGSFYPIPLSWPWFGPQMEYGIRRNMMALHLKRYGRKYGYRGIDDVTELEKFESGQDGALIDLGATGQIMPIADAPLDQGHYFDTSQLRKEFDEVSGVGDLQRARLGADSATEAQIVEQRGQQGEVDQHEVVMEFISEAVKKLHRCVEVNLTQDGAIAVTGPIGQSWLYFGPENFQPIEGEFIFDVAGEEAERQTQMVERAQLIQFIDLIMRNPILALSETLMKTLLDQFPALAGNQMLQAELFMLGRFMLETTMGGGAPQQAKGEDPNQRPKQNQGQVEKEARPTNIK